MPTLNIGKISPSDFYNDGTTQVITHPFGEDRGTHLHGGIDISTRDPDGTPIPKEFVTPVGGEVQIVPDSEWNTINVIQPDGYVVQFLHASELYSELDGSVVPPGTPLGVTGNTGAEDLHLHVQVRTPSGDIVDPEWFFDSTPDYPRTASSRRDLLDLEYRFTLPDDTPFQSSSIPNLLLPAIGAAIGAAISSFMALPLETPSELLRLVPDWACEQLLYSTMPTATLPLAVGTGFLAPMAEWAIRRWNS